MESVQKKKICFVTTFWSTAQKFLQKQIIELSKVYDITVIADFSDEADLERIKKLPVHYYKVSIPRKIDFIGDFKSIIALVKIFRKERFWAIHSLFHKSGLVAPIAGLLAGCKHRIYIFTGQYWASRTGIKRTILKYSDWVIAKLNNHILVDGESQRKFLEDEGIVNEKKSIVLGKGSICGVDLKKFTPEQAVKKDLRNKIGIPENYCVYLYMGRYCKDKGLTELIEAYSRLCKDYTDVYMVFVGWDEDNYLERIKTYSNIKEGVNFYNYGPTSEPEKVYQLCDVFCMPSYREGFGMSVIEASALEIPVVCSDVYGILDSYVDGVTGLKCKVRDVDSLEKNMRLLHDDSELRKRMGHSGRERTKKLFDSDYVAKCWVDYYGEL